MVNLLHAVERRIHMEVELRNNTKLIVLQVAQLKANGSLVFLYLGNNLLTTIGWEDRKVDMCDAQVGGNAHLTYRNKEAIAQALGIAKKDIAQILLHEAGNLLLTCCLHKNNVLRFEKLAEQPAVEPEAYGGRFGNVALVTLCSPTGKLVLQENPHERASEGAHEQLRSP